MKPTLSRKSLKYLLLSAILPNFVCIIKSYYLGNDNKREQLLYYSCRWVRTQVMAMQPPILP